MDWIQGNKFKELANWAYAPKVKQYAKDDYDNLKNTLDLSLLKDGDIIYTHMMYASLLLNIMAHLDKKFILITHSCDYSVEDFGMIRPDGNGKVAQKVYFGLPENLIKWYTKNVNTVNPKIESIPIGLENDWWCVKVHKKEKMIEKLNEPKNYKNLVYMNFKIGTNPEKRQPVYDLLKDKSWVTTRMGSNGVNFDNYIDNIYNHKFVVCPEGNGIDTHRLWETLYMGSIPIVKCDNENCFFYEDLPILIVDEWEELTEDWLDLTHTIYSQKIWNVEKLTFEYWKNKILKNGSN